MTTAGSQAARWSVRRCAVCSPMSSKVRVDVIVVYKVDRLTRSLADFAKMVEVFDAHGVSFVAVTQQFNTTTSMGRLTLNVLLSFAQFEREVTGERIRDKIAASKKKGMWMGGFVPVGYLKRDRRLVIDEQEAETVRLIFRRYNELKSVRLLKQDLDRRGLVSKVRIGRNGLKMGGKAYSRGKLYKLLSNPIYKGEIRHLKTCHPGQHQPIIDGGLWDKTQRLLAEHAVRRANGSRKANRQSACRQTVRREWPGIDPDPRGEEGAPPPLLRFACASDRGPRRYCRARMETSGPGN